MKLYKIKDALAVVWFFVLAILQDKKYYKTVLYLLFIGMLMDLIITFSNIGDINIQFQY